jgi:hypothetical protein
VSLALVLAEASCLSYTSGMSPPNCAGSTTLSRVGARALLAYVLISVATGCVGGNTRGKALFPESGPTRAENEVARLTGEIGSVDGRDVSGEGQSFELLPGCHVVTTRTSWGKFEYGEGLYGNMPQQSFAISMQANRTYEFQYELVNRTGSGGTMVLHVRERDANARVIAELLAASADELAQCRAKQSSSTASSAH